MKSIKNIFKKYMKDITIAKNILKINLCEFRIGIKEL